MQPLQCLLFQHKGTAKLQNRLQRLPAGTLLVSDQITSAYSQQLVAHCFARKELERFRSFVTRLGHSDEYRALLPSPSAPQRPSLKWHGQAIGEWQARFAEHGAGGEALAWFCLLAVDDVAFFNLFAGTPARLAQSIQDDSLGFFEFLALRACLPKGARALALKIWKSWRKFNRVLLERQTLSACRWTSQVKLQRAASLLTETALQISKVGSLCGFANHAYFSAKFRERFACSPRAWRQLTANLPEFIPDLTLSLFEERQGGHLPNFESTHKFCEPSRPKPPNQADR